MSAFRTLIILVIGAFIRKVFCDLDTANRFVFCASGIGFSDLVTCSAWFFDRKECSSVSWQNDNAIFFCLNNHSPTFAWRFHFAHKNCHVILSLAFVCISTLVPKLILHIIILYLLNLSTLWSPTFEYFTI